MATAFSQVATEDEDKDIFVILFAAFGQLVVAIGFGLGGIVIPADSHFKILTLVKTSMHILLIVCLLRMVRDVFNRKQALGKLPLPASELQKLKNEPVKSAIALWNYDVGDPTASSESRRLGRFVLGIGIVFGAWWQFQSMLSVFLPYALQVSKLDEANSLRFGLNFAMHGAAITVFDFVLSFQNEASWTFMKTLVIMGCFGGAASSFMHMLRVGNIADVSYGTLVSTFFLGRALIGIFFGIAFALVKRHPSESYIALAKDPPSQESPNIDMVDTRAQQSTGSLPSRILYLFRGHASNVELTALLFYWLSVLFYSVTVVLKFRYIGAVSTGFWTMNAEVGGGWRFVDFPPGYGEIFHFIFILGAFAIHWFIIRFEPSRWIGIFFASTSLILGIFQLWVLENESNHNVKILTQTSSSVLAVASIILVYYLYIGHAKPGYAVIIGDIWH